MPALSRRDLLKASAALPLLYAAPVRAAAPPPEAITPALIAAATKEGAVVWYTSADLQLAATGRPRPLSGNFPASPRGSSAPAASASSPASARNMPPAFTRPMRCSTGDAAQFLAWKRLGCLAPYVPEDVAKHIPDEHRDADGFYATVRSSLCVIAYNTDMVKQDDAPKSFADLLDPKWKGKIVKAHPSYSGTIMTSTYQMVRELGWPYLEKLAKQNVLQVQSATDTPKKIVLGERAVMADGNEFERAAAQGGRQADRGGLRQRRLALDRAAVGDLCRSAASQRRAAVSELSVQRRGRSGCSSMSAGCVRCMPWSKTSRAARRCRPSRSGRTIRLRSRPRATSSSAIIRRFSTSDGSRVCRLASPKLRLYKPQHHSRGPLALGPDNGSKRPSGGPFTGLTHVRGGSTGEDYGAS